MLVWGLEGKHYNKLAENRIELIEESDYAGLKHFYIGSQKNIYLLEYEPDDLIQQIADFNTSAIPSPILGFAADITNITTEIANCNRIVSKRGIMLDLGLVDADTGLEEFKKELEAAGVNTIIAELQKQIDIWWETK